MADDPRKAEHDARVKALNEANLRSAKVQAMPPTPTQEENDLIALGLMHIDDKGVSNEALRTRRPPSQHRAVPRPSHTRDRPPVEPARRSYALATTALARVAGALSRILSPRREGRRCRAVVLVAD